jgi:parallel beta-helix repeat protein
MYSPRVGSPAESLVRPWLLPLLVLVLLGATVLPTFAATIKVPADYANLQTAVFLASTGDTILVSPGSYAAFDFYGKNVTVKSTNPTSASVVASTIITGAGGASVVTFQHGETRAAVLTGFTVTGATASGGAGVVVTTSSSPTISNCVITGNAIGISATKTSPALIENCTINNNTGLGITTDSSCAITQNVIENNVGGIAATGAAYITSNLIANNTCSTDGAGVLANGSGILLQGNVIANNSSDGNGGGASCVLGTRLESNTFYGNSAGKAGGNIYAALSTVYLHNCLISDARVGGGISVATGIVPSLAYCDLWNNGGGNYVGLPDQTGTHGDFSANPLYVSAGTNFHLKSQAGHWTASGFVLDSMTSPCLAAGDPSSPYNLQPTPNGGAIEVGAYGDTAQASKSNGPVAPPSITKGPTVTPSPVVEGTTAQCSVTATDKSPYKLTYQWTAVDQTDTPAGTFDNATLAAPNWTAPATITGNSQQYHLTVLVSSSSGKTVQGSTYVTVIVPPADAVNITAGPTATPATVIVSQQTACSVTAVDTDGYTLTYAWTAVDAGNNAAGKFNDPTSATPKWTAPATVVGNSQTFVLTVVVTNSKALTATGSIYVRVTPLQDLVTITAGPTASPSTISQGQQTSLSVTAKDALAKPLTYAWTATDSLGHPAGTFNDSAFQTPQWTAPSTGSGTLTYTLTVLVTCPTSGQTATKYTKVTVLVEQLLVVTPAAGDANPVLAGGTVDCSVSITDSLGYGLTYAWIAQDGQGHAVGSFDDSTSSTPVWTAPASLPASPVNYFLRVTAHSTHGATTKSSYYQKVVTQDVFVLSLPAAPNVSALATAGVQPATAPPGTSFTFQMNYLDTANLAPQSVQVRVWAPGASVTGPPTQTLAMATTATSYRTPALYTAALVLSTDGLYHYQFVVQGPTGTVKKLPATGSLAGPFVNTPPQANWVGTVGYTSGGVQPTSGASGTQFTFEVRYSEAEGYAPTFVRLWVWGTRGNVLAGSPFTMTTTNVAPHYETGVVYQKTLTLSGSGTCQYRFEVSDGGPSVTLPATGTALGPGLTTAPAVSVSALSAQQVGAGLSLTYTLAAPAQVEVVVLNMAGRVIADLTPAGPQAAGLQSLPWTGRNLTGSLVPAGVYLLRVSARAPDGTQAQALTAVSLRR